jgi:hypothetical protein
VQMTSSTLHPSPCANRRPETLPGAPKASRRCTACSTSTAIFAKNFSPAAVITVLTHMTTLETDFLSALHAAEKSREIPADADLYGWLIGSWDLDVIRYGIDLTPRGIKGEAHFGWVLEGRAVQDIWTMHADDFNMHGTTLRVWDPAIQAWRITWIDPASRRREELIGRRAGDEIVQTGARPDGTAIRWLFTEITRNSFRWTGESLEADGKTWKLEGEFRATRRTK